MIPSENIVRPYIVIAALPLVARNDTSTKAFALGQIGEGLVK